MTARRTSAYVKLKYSVLPLVWDESETNPKLANFREVVKQFSRICETTLNMETRTGDDQALYKAQKVEDAVRLILELFDRENA